MPRTWRLLSAWCDLCGRCVINCACRAGEEFEGRTFSSWTMKPVSDLESWERRRGTHIAAQSSEPLSRPKVVRAISIYKPCLESGPVDVRRGGSGCPRSSEPTASPYLLVTHGSIRQSKAILTMIAREPSQKSRVESGCQMYDQTEGASKPRMTPRRWGTYCRAV